VEWTLNKEEHNDSREQKETKKLEKSTGVAESKQLRIKTKCRQNKQRRRGNNMNKNMQREIVLKELGRYNRD